MHTLTEASRDAALREALQAASFLFADGVPLLWLARATHRLAGEPGRLWKRYLLTNARFARLVARELTASRRS